MSLYRDYIIYFIKELKDIESERVLKKLIKKLVPVKIKKFIYKIKMKLNRHLNKNKTTVEIFSNIYSKNMWGGSKGSFYSGEGSDCTLSMPYSEYFSKFISSKFSLGGVRILDLGCGDFRVGKALVNERIEYIGVDVVPSLVQRNNDEFGSPTIDFRCLDIIEDELPDADICLIRQVFQHLSNDQICKTLNKLRKYRYVFITEHYPDDMNGCIPNIDKPPGSDIRYHDDSAVFLDQPPFSLKDVELVLSVSHNDWGRLHTFKLENDADVVDR